MSTEQTTDRGDDFIPTDDAEDAATKAAADAAAAALAQEITDKAAADKDDPKVEADDKTKGKDTRLPLARHEAILTKERERREVVERELATLKQGKEVATINEDITAAEVSLTKLEADYAKLVSDGEHEKAAKIMGDIRRTERGIIQTRAQFDTQAAEMRAYERVRYDTTVERLEAAYPALNPDHAEFNAELTKEVVELRDGFIATGKYGRAEAIQKAAKTLMGATTTRQETAVGADVKVDKGDVAAQVTKDRAEAARKKAAETVGKQPPNTKDVGLDNDKMGGGLSAKAVMNMSQAEFAKLDEAALKRIRGDEVTA